MGKDSGLVQRSRQGRRASHVCSWIWLRFLVTGTCRIRFQYICLCVCERYRQTAIWRETDRDSERGEVEGVTI